MRIDKTFRFSTWLALCSSCLCLGQAEQSFIPDVFFLVGAVILLLTIGCLLEKRWTLPIWAANLIGVLIAAGASSWLIAYLIRTEQLEYHPIVWAASSMPYLGTLLLVLLAVASFRPRQVRDYWLFHGIGFLQVVLACVLATETVFSVFLVAYVLTAVWSLGLFYLHRHESAAATTASSAAAAPTASMPSRSLGLVSTARWMVPVTLVALPLFFMTPRVGEGEWDPFSLLGAKMPGKKPQTGASEQIDMNFTGSVDIDDEVVVVVSAFEDAEGKNPKLDLDPEQRWRGVALDYYDKRTHSWLSRPNIRAAVRESASRLTPPDVGPQPFPPAGDQPRGGAAIRGNIASVAPDMPIQVKLPDLGPKQFFLEFSLTPNKAGGLFLAEPALLTAGAAPLPVISIDHVPLFYASTERATVQAIQRPSALTKPVHYRQVTVPLEDAKIHSRSIPRPECIDDLCEQPVPDLTEWTVNLLHALANRNSALPRDLGAKVDMTRHAESSVLVAQALCEHLSSSGEYTYTLDLRAENKSIDPTMDFLLNVKQGHCERFAAALTLMLRSVKIPARVVKGFRGADSRGDGTYDIRNSHAHAWVEALVWQPGTDGKLEQGWLILDPTPSSEAEVKQAFSWSRWLKSQQRALITFWREFVIDYDPDRQAIFLENLWFQIAPVGGRPVSRSPLAWIVVAVLLLPGVWVLYRLQRRRAARSGSGSAVVAFYARLLAILSRSRNLQPAPTQTAREFGAAAGQALRHDPVTAAVADLPAKLCALYYRVRYGAAELSAAELNEVNAQLDRLAAALAG